MMYLVDCNSAVLAGFLTIFKNILSLIQIVGPLLAMCSITFILIRMIQNPEEKKFKKKLMNSCIALGALFFIPMLVTVVLNMVDSSTDFGACWNNSGNKGFGNAGYIEIDDGKDRVNIIDNGNYESGVPNSNNNSSSNTASSNNNSNSNTPSAKPIIDKGGSRVIFIGDSRTVQMYSYVANTWKNNSYSTGGVTQVGNDLFVAQGSMGLNWMKSTGIPAAKTYFKSGVSVAILMGVNDLRNQDSYIEYLNSNINSWTATGAKFYFVTVNPCDGWYSSMNSRIKSFNTNLKNKLSKKIGWINTHDNISFVTVDGLHYNKNTSIEIYNYIKNRV